VPFVGQAGVGPDGYPTESVSVLGVRALLRHRKFAELTRVVEGWQRDFEADPKKEYWVTDALAAFSSADATLEPLLNAWIAEQPRSFAGYVARGGYYEARAWDARGTERVSKTTPAQLAAMRGWLDLAESDYERAIAIEPDAIAAYMQLITGGKLVGKGEPAFRRAVARFPLSFRLHWAGMMASTPRWGGSYAKMGEIAALGESHAAANPRMKLLPGFVDYAIYEDRTTAKDYEGALAAAESALKYGEHWHFFPARGDARLRLENWKGALEGFDRALALQPQLPGVLRGRASALWKLNRYEEAADSYLSSLTIARRDYAKKLEAYANLFVFVGNKHFNAGRSREALAAYDKALLLVPAHAEAKRWRTELLRRGDPTLDDDEVKRLHAAAAQSDTFEAYRRARRRAGQARAHERGDRGVERLLAAAPQRRPRLPRARRRLQSDQEDERSGAGRPKGVRPGRERGLRARQAPAGDGNGQVGVRFSYRHGPIGPKSVLLGSFSRSPTMSTPPGTRRSRMACRACAWPTSSK